MVRRLIDRMSSRWTSVQLKSCGASFRITTDAVIGAPDRISIGRNFVGVGQLFLLANDGEIAIGDNVGLNRNVEINAGQGRIVMGNDILIALNVVLRSVVVQVMRERTWAAHVNCAGDPPPTKQ